MMKKRLFVVLLALSITAITSVVAFGIIENEPLPIPTAIIIDCNQ